MGFAALALVQAFRPAFSSRRSSPSFDDAMAARAKAQLEPGEAAIKGSAFLRKPSGSFVTAGGEWVYLIPATPYAEERFRKLFSDNRYNSAVFGRGIETADPRYSELMRKLKAHKDGSFRFEDIKPGRAFRVHDTDLDAQGRVPAAWRRDLRRGHGEGRRDRRGDPVGEVDVGLDLSVIPGRRAAPERGSRRDWAQTQASGPWIPFPPSLLRRSPGDDGRGAATAPR